MKRCLVTLTLIVVLCLPLSHASAAVMTGLGLGSDAQNTFADWVSTFGGTYIDFENLSQGTHLTSQYSHLGVNFESTINYYGSPISNYVYVDTSITKEIIGSPFSGAAHDGRVVYEVQFDSPQRWAGLTRHFFNTSTITNFYNETGGLIDTVQGYGDGTYTPIFAGYLAETDDPTQWVKTIECTGIEVPSIRQVGYTDNVYFGTSAIDYPDSDSDGVPDAWDQCPDTPTGSCTNNQGCLCEGFYTEEQMNQMVSNILMWGDTNNDGKIGLAEAIQALRITSRVTPP